MNNIQFNRSIKIKIPARSHFRQCRKVEKSTSSSEEDLEKFTCRTFFVGVLKCGFKYDAYHPIRTEDNNRPSSFSNWEWTTSYCDDRVVDERFCFHLILEVSSSKVTVVVCDYSPLQCTHTIRRVNYTGYSERWVYNIRISWFTPKSPCPGDWSTSNLRITGRSYYDHVNWDSHHHVIHVNTVLHDDTGIWRRNHSSTLSHDVNSTLQNWRST
jgi:hypothetical protein